MIEEFLFGKEASFIVISDGVKILPLVTTMDHKAVYDGDKGPNTGGMGAISPSPFIDRQMFDDIVNTIVFPTITRMLEEGRRFKGVLYVGLMLTEDGPKVLEYNCRFGDPETQPQMLRMESDIVELFLAAAEEDILRQEIQWNDKASGCVILASGGYPGEYEKGIPIRGVDEAARIPGIEVFHAGTELKEKRLFTKGGRVLGVCASEATLTETMEKIYKAITKIEFRGMHYRRDIGRRRALFPWRPPRLFLIYVPTLHNIFNTGKNQTPMSREVKNAFQRTDRAMHENKTGRGPSGNAAVRDGGPPGAGQGIKSFEK